ncbi:MAG TPA: hypothetical protein VFK30_02325, partial [Anaerolineae bacterium]|nr:hypothetical protein [Anaerolineae bacterium]
MLNLLRRLLIAPTFDTEEKTRTASLLNIILPSGALIAFGLLLFTVLFGTPEIRNLYVGAIATLMMLGLWFLMRRGYVHQTSVALLITLWVIVTLLVYLAGSIRDPIAGMYLIQIVMAGLLTSSRLVVVFVALDTATLLGLMLLEQAGQLNQVSLFTGLPEWITFVAVFCIGAILLELAGRNIRSSLEQARRNEQSLIRSNRDLQVIRTSLE